MPCSFCRHVIPKKEEKKSHSRLNGYCLQKVTNYGVHGAGSRGNQSRQRPLAQRGKRGFEMCCAGMGAAANIGGPGCCPYRSCRASTYQGRLPVSKKIAGSTYACPQAFPVK